MKTVYRVLLLVKRFGPAATFFFGTQFAVAAMPKILTTKDDVVTKIICPAADIFFTVILTVSIISILYAAYLYLTAAGDAAKIKQASQTITYAAAGIAVAILANSVPVVVNALLGGGVTLNTCSTATTP